MGSCPSHEISFAVPVFEYRRGGRADAEGCHCFLILCLLGRDPEVLGSGESCCNGDCLAVGSFQTCVDNCGSCGNECPWAHPHCTDSYCYNVFEIALSLL